MEFADISNPVVIQATKSVTTNIDNYLRRMCIISTGGTNLDVGNYKEITYEQVSNILNENENENVINLKNKLNGFFSVASIKKVMIVEVGEFSSNNSITQQVTYLQDYIINSDKKSYCYYVPSIWYYPPDEVVELENSNIKVNTSLIILKLPTPEGEVVQDTSDTNYTSEYILPLETNIQLENLNVTIDNSNIFEYNKNSNIIIAKEKGEATLTLSGKVNLNEGEEVSVQVKIKVYNYNDEVVLTDNDKLLIDTTIKDTSENGNKSLGRDLAFLELANLYLTMKAHTYFFIETDKSDPDASEAFKLYDNKKSIFCVHDNLSNSYPLTSLILGIIASNYYDLSSTQLATPLNFKILNGVTIENITSETRNNLIQAPINFAGELAGNNVIMNGRYTDGTAWEYYYQWDTLEYEIILKLQSLILNGVNSTNAVIQYNQNGIDILKANIKSVLILWKGRGLLTAFARSYDISSSSMVGENDIEAISFDTYIQNNPDDYKKEIYNGFSFYVIIGRYPRQIVINATLN